MTARHCCRFRAPLIELNENKQSRNYHSLQRVQVYSSTRFTLLVELVQCLATRSAISFLHPSTAVSVPLLSPPRPPGFAWLLLLASSAVRRCQLFSASPPCHLVTKRSAASTIPRCQFPLSLAALGHSTVATPNSKGELSVDPSVASKTLMSSTRHWAQFFPGRPRPGFTPPAIVPNITRWVSRSLAVRCPAPAKRRRRLRIAVSMLSHCAFLRALAYDMRWSLRCRR